MKKTLISIILFFLLIGCVSSSNINVCPSLIGKTKINLFVYDTCAWEVVFYLNQMLKCENNCDCETTVIQEETIKEYTNKSKVCSIIRIKIKKDYK